MAKDEYTIGQASQQASSPPRGPGARMGTGEKANDLVGTWKKLLRYCKSYLPALIAGVLCAVLGTLLTLVGPNKLSQLTDLISSGMVTGVDLTAIARIGLFLVAVYAASYVLSAAQGWIMAGVTQRVSKRMRSDLSDKIGRLPMWFFNRTSVGDILSRFTNDVDTIGQSLTHSIGNLIHAAILFVGSLVMMLITNRILTLTAIVAVLIGFAAMRLIMSRSQKYFRKQQKSLGAINGHIEEMYAGHTVVKAYNGEAEAQRVFDGLNDELRQSGFRAQCLSGLMMPIMQFIGNFGYVAVCAVGGALALQGRIGFGVIVAFMLYVRYFTQPLSQIAQSMQSLQSAAAAGERVFAFLEAEEMADETGKPGAPDDVQGAVDFDHVRFGPARPEDRHRGTHRRGQDHHGQSAHALP